MFTSQITEDVEAPNLFPADVVEVWSQLHETIHKSDGYPNGAGLTHGDIVRLSELEFALYKSLTEFLTLAQTQE